MNSLTKIDFLAGNKKASFKEAFLRSEEFTYFFYA